MNILFQHTLIINFNSPKKLLLSCRIPKLFSNGKYEKLHHQISPTISPLEQSLRVLLGIKSVKFIYHTKNGSLETFPSVAYCSLITCWRMNSSLYQ